MSDELKTSPIWRYESGGYSLYTLNVTGSLVIRGPRESSGVILREWASQDVTWLKELYPDLPGLPNSYTTRTGDIIIRKLGPNHVKFYDMRDSTSATVKGDVYIALGLYLAQYNYKEWMKS
jgi:hypothetical protein